jgi:(E)-4-hydroxy-3-methyl-but-2-enyl pyrophosphate reductase
LKVRQAKTAGFCMGVRRAMEMVLAEANKNGEPIFTYGPLIHNKQVLELLESKKVRSILDINELKKGTILIRAHGITPLQRKRLKEGNLKIIDATCPRVARVQAIIRYHAKKGYTPVIVGDRDHAEVIGLLGYGNGLAHVITNPSDVSDLPRTDKMVVVAQTTQNEQNFNRIVEAIQERSPNALIFNTICDATRNRQDEVRSLAEHVDAMVVVGGYHSGNTQRLVEVSKAVGRPTYHVETEKELDKEALSTMDVIGVTAGASTPNWLIKDVVQEIESIRSRGETFLDRWLKKFFKFLLFSNFLVGAGAFSFSYAINILIKKDRGILYPTLAFLYIYAMHVLNRFLDKGVSTYNDPERAHFYNRHRIYLIVTGVCAILGSLVIGAYIDWTLFFAMVAISLLGIIYSFNIVPIRIQHLWPYSKIKDIPASKTLAEALAWTVVITVIPLLEMEHIDWPTAIIAFYIVLSIAYVRSAFFEILQVQGDMIMGVESLPITLGEKKTLFLLKCVILSSAVFLILPPILEITSPFSYILALPLLPLSYCLWRYEKGFVTPGPRIEFFLEGTLLLGGLFALIWQFLS